MGSGLILLLIVGAWLAVLVPMALRSHDTSTALKSADRFSDAMRVLSRRGARDVLVPKRSHSSLVISETRSARPVAPVAPAPPVAPRSAAERRLRTLQVLFGLALVTLGLGLYGLRLFLVAHVACDLLLVLFVVHLRRQALFKAQRAARAARRRPVAARQAPRIAGIPDRMPLRPTALTQPLPAPATRYEDKPTPAAAAQDSSWSPVPVPLPVYVGKAVAPKRQPRVLDLTQPGQWTAGLDGEDAGLDILDDGPDLEDIIDRRRAVNGW